MNEPGYPTLRLHKGKDRSVRNFHPWIFSGAVASDIRDIAEGQLVEVFDAGGTYLATGHFHKGTIMVRVLSFRRCPVDAAFWNEQFNRAWQVRIALPRLIGGNTNAFRLVHGEGDSLPGLVVDIYNGHAVVQTHSEGMVQSLPAIADALEQLTDLKLQGIYHRNVGTENSGFLKGTQPETTILENGHSYVVNWVEGQKTGFFLDQRDNRNLLASYATGKRMLNTYCYTGGFSVYALTAGAKSVDSVDSSAKATALTVKNGELNGALPGQHQVHTNDVQAFLKSSNDVFDLIVVDPPAFAKHLSAVDQAIIGYRNLNEEAIRRVAAGGIVFTFSCSQAVDRQLFRKIVFMASAKTGRSVRILHQLTQGADHPVNIYHPEGEYLKGLVLRVD